MGNPGISKEDLLEALQLVHDFGSVYQAAKAMGIPRGTLENRHKRALQAAARGDFGTGPVIPGFEITRTTADVDAEGNVTREHIQQRPARSKAGPLPDDHTVKGISRYVDGQGNVIGEWIKTKRDGPDPVKTAEGIAKAFDGIKVKLPTIPKPKGGVSDLLTLYPLADFHLGLMTWGDETSENWDLEIAEEAIRNTMAEVFAATPNSKTAIVLGVGDFIHSDNNKNVTNHSGNILDVDGRYQKIVHKACDLALDMVLMAMQKHEHVIVRFLPGNHDEHTAVAITHFLRGAFQNEKRVTVDTDPSLFFVYPFGLTLIAATHGHTLKPQKLYQFLTSQYRKEWGDAEKVYGWVGHFHHKEKIAEEMGGMLIEILPAPIPPDAWHYGSGYISGRAILAITYHNEHGEISRDTRTMRKS